MCITLFDLRSTSLLCGVLFAVQLQASMVHVPMLSWKLLVMSGFIVKEIIHFDGKYHDNTSELAQPQYRDLVDFARLELNKMIIREFMELMS